MAVRLGITPLTWTNDDLSSVGTNTSLETCLSEYAEQSGLAVQPDS